MQDHPQHFDWNTLTAQIRSEFYKNFLGIALSSEMEDASRHLFDWLFICKADDLQATSTQYQQRVSQSFSDLYSLFTNTVQQAKLPSDLESASLVARAIQLQSKLKLSDKDTINLLIGISLGISPFLEKGFNILAQCLAEDRLLRPKIYQAASINNTDAIMGFINNIKAIQKLYRTHNLFRTVTEDHSLKNRSLKKDEQLILSLDTKEFESKGYPESLTFNKESPDKNYLLFGVEPQLVFGQAMATQVLSSTLDKLFSVHRIKLFSNNQLELEKLPQNSDAYQFKIMGSSPPWAVGEEQAWLLETYGMYNHLQYNILSFKEFFSLLILKTKAFHNKNFFYTVYEKKHHLAFGSSFAGAGQATVEMGYMFHVFFSNLAIKGIRPARDFAGEAHYQDILQAYSTIRKNYYTWAYFSAFLDKGYKFVFKALLLFTRKKGFKPLSIIGEGLLALVIGLVALLLFLPITKTRIQNTFEKTIADNLVNIRSSIAVIDKVLSDGRQYLFGDEFSAADLHICANMVNLVVPDEFHGGNILPPLDQYPPSYRKNVEEFRQSLTGQYVLRVYRQHRLSQ